jgi:rhamnosyltransferase subunit B
MRFGLYGYMGMTWHEMTPPRILLTTFGSDGDLLPMVALAQALVERHAAAVVGSSERHREKVESSGVEFVPLRPDMPELGEQSELARKLLDPKNGARHIVELIAMRHLSQAYEDTLGAARGCDALVCSALSMATPLVAAKLSIPWASAVYQPMAFMSAYDPPTLPMAPWLDALRGWGALGVALRKFFFAQGMRSVRPWCAEHARLADAMGIQADPDPLFGAARSSWLSLAMFSPSMGEPQPDWPASAVQTGFPIPRAQAESLPKELMDFLGAGSAPITFTLGTAAVHASEGFYQASKAAAERLGLRAVFLTGAEGQNAMGELPSSMMALPYADHGALFKRSVAVVHPCGIGTCAKSLRAAVPVLAVPWAHDQPDNARRLSALGVAKVLPRRLYGEKRAAMALSELTTDPGYKEAAKRMAMAHAGVDGAARAADALLDRLRTHHK